MDESGEFQVSLKRADDGGVRVGFSIAGIVALFHILAQYGPTIWEVIQSLIAAFSGPQPGPAPKPPGPVISK